MRNSRGNDRFFQYDGRDLPVRELAKQRYANLSPEHVDRAFSYEVDGTLNEEEILDCLELADDEWHAYGQMLDEGTATQENVNQIKKEFQDNLYDIIDDPVATRFYNDMLKTVETLRAENQGFINNNPGYNQR